MAETKNDRARRKRDAVAAVVAAKANIDAAVDKRQTAKSKIRPELDAAEGDLRKAEEEYDAATTAAVKSGDLVPGDTIVSDGYVITVTKKRGNKVSVSVRKTETGSAPKRSGRSGKVKKTDESSTDSESQ